MYEVEMRIRNAYRQSLLRLSLSSFHVQIFQYPEFDGRHIDWWDITRVVNMTRERELIRKN